VFSFSIDSKKDSSEGYRSNWGESQMEGNSYYSLKSKKSVEKNGVQGTRWEYSPSDGDVADIIYYYFSNEDLIFVFTVNSNGG
jgi:hypothetical protein